MPCRAAAYRFAFADPRTATAATLGGRSTFALRPGETFDFLFGTFHPDAGSAPLGAYAFHGATAQLELYGVDAQDLPVTAYVTLATTCASL